MMNEVMMSRSLGIIHHPRLLHVVSRVPNPKRIHQRSQISAHLQLRREVIFYSQCSNSADFSAAFI